MIRRFTEFDKVKKDKPKPKYKPLKETVVKVGDAFKVRTSYEVPVDMVDQFLKKVKKESGENPLEDWSKQDVAEEMVSFCLNKFLKLDNIPTEIISGEQETQDELEQEREQKTAEMEVEGDENNEQEEIQVKIKNEKIGLYKKFTDQDLEFY